MSGPKPPLSPSQLSMTASRKSMLTVACVGSPERLAVTAVPRANWPSKPGIAA